MSSETQTVLIVEDTPENLYLLKRILTPLCQVRTATCGQEALASLREVVADLVLLDVMMPDIDGYEVCRLIKAEEAWKDIPVVFLTALDEAAQEERGLELGAVDYVIKPFNPQIIRLRVRNLLELKRQRDLLQQRTLELERALSEVRQLSGLLPICAWCKNVRDDQGYWRQIEEYIGRRTDATFTHGVCERCADKMVAQLEAADPPTGD